MSQNWMRHFELQLVDDKGKGIDFGDFKVTFNIDWFNLSSESRVGTFKIYNLSTDTVNRITRGEFSRIRVIAGYDGMDDDSDSSNYGLLFDGEVRYTITGKDNPVDSF